MHSGADYALPAETAALIREAVPENTALAYRSRWRSFEAWCRDAGRVALPATAQTVAAYLTHLAVDRGLKATTADAHLTAIRAVHRGAGAPLPDGLAARKVVVAAQRREAARDGRYGPRKAVPVMAADLPAIVAACDLETAAGLRDRAVILLGFALLARRAELAALSVSDIEHVPGEGLAVTIRASKTDQSARGVVRRDPLRVGRGGLPGPRGPRLAGVPGRARHHGRPAVHQDRPLGQPRRRRGRPLRGGRAGPAEPAGTGRLRPRPAGDIVAGGGCARRRSATSSRRAVPRRRRRPAQARGHRADAAATAATACGAAARPRC